MQILSSICAHGYFKHRTLGSHYYPSVLSNFHSNRKKVLIAGQQKSVEVAKGNSWKSFEFSFSPMTRFQVESVPWKVSDTTEVNLFWFHHYKKATDNLT